MAEYTSKSKEAETDSEKMASNLEGNYDKNWKIPPMELIQNLIDIHGEHAAMGLIDSEREITGRIEIISEDNAIRYTDKGVGGMRKEIMEKIVRKLGSSTKNESGTGGGSFGVGLFMTARICKEGADGLYIESVYEEAEKSHSTFIHKSIDVEDVEEPSELKEAVGIDGEVGVETSDWDEGGSVLYIDNVEDHIIEALSDREKVEEMILSKYPFVGGIENLEIEYVIDGESEVIETPSVDDIVGEVVLREKDISVPSEDVENSIDEFVIFEVEDGEEKPWGKDIPIMKSHPDSGEPYMVIDYYSPTEANSITAKEKMMGAYIVVDTICDEDNVEDMAHSSLTGVDMYKTDIKDICQRKQKEIVEENPMDYIEINQDEMVEEAMVGLGQMKDKVYEVVDDPESAGIKYEKRAEISMRLSEEDLSGEVIIERGENINGNVKLRVDYEVCRQEGDETVVSKSEMRTLEENEDKISYEKDWDVEEEGSYMVEIDLIDVRARKKIDRSGGLFGVGKDVSSSNQRSAGATPTKEGAVADKYESNDNVIDLEDVEIRDVLIQYPDSDSGNSSPELTRVSDDDMVYDFYVPLDWDKLKRTLTLKKSDRLEEQKKIIEEKVKGLALLRVASNTDGDVSWFDSVHGSL